ncbi:9611_t:CDS:2 [Acaulospora colombiana]|uniref:9611_t:CDS:1 n=1 Tax=Acaulospora colombiana TaxID=27376 RepID=A0ACA9K2X9_9GLOM|nr:9611_t:CDS:2 [Acaulospora colombiana]
MASTAMQLQRRIYSFWFKEYTSGKQLDQSLLSFWFQGGEAVDNECRENFSKDLEEVLKGNHVEELKKTPEGTLSLTILLDQIPRNIYRGTARPFVEFDPLALDTCKYALGKKWDEVLDSLERVFLYLPLEHSENMEDQILCVEKFRRNVENCPPVNLNLAKSFLKYAEDHKYIIEKFGRYPRRNKCLGRESTQEELEFLKTSHIR